jgi:hypothetical protein
MIWVERTGSVGRLAVSLGLTAGEQPHKANARRQATGRRIALTSLVEICLGLRLPRRVSRCLRMDAIWLVYQKTNRANDWRD